MLIMDDVMSNNFEIPLYKPDLSGNERKYVNECIESSWISSKGRFVPAFEAMFCSRIGVEHSTAVCNGTIALHLAMVALGIGQGDEVIVPTLTYVAPVNAITYSGAKPIFVDSEAVGWQIDPADVVRHITPNTRAILAVHLYGAPCDIASLKKIATENNLFLIEDCAEAFGTKFRGEHVGTFGDIGTFSFYGNKTITTGEGGMLVSNDKTLIERARHFKGQGLAAHREYWHDVIGYNYRMTNIAAAIGLAQLERADEFIARKREIAEFYQRELGMLPIQFHAELEGTTHSYWMISILTDKSADRDSLRVFLAGRGIETRPVFYPVHTMPMYSKNYCKHPVAEDLSWRGLNLPSWPGLTKKDLERIASAVRDYY